MALELLLGHHQLCGLSVILLVLFYFPPGWDLKHEGVVRTVEVKRFDYTGSILYTTGLILLLLGLCESPWYSEFNAADTEIFFLSLGWYHLPMAVYTWNRYARHWVHFFNFLMKVIGHTKYQLIISTVGIMAFSGGLAAISHKHTVLRYEPLLPCIIPIALTFYLPVQRNWWLCRRLS